jgi:hypothetical protein
MVVLCKAFRGACEGVLVKMCGSNQVFVVPNRCAQLKRMHQELCAVGLEEYSNNWTAEASRHIGDILDERISWGQLGLQPCTSTSTMTGLLTKQEDILETLQPKQHLKGQIGLRLC